MNNTKLESMISKAAEGAILKEMMTLEVAVNKTFTSTAFQMSTAKLADLCRPGESLYGLQFSNDGKVMILGGGEPLMIGNTMIGALGVSGASAEDDSYLAAFGAAALKEVITCL